MWNGKKKAVTFSYDDGVAQDIRLIEMFNRYGLRATFNLNPDKQRENDTFIKSGIVVRHLNLRDLPKIYAGHEVAGHTCTHPHLEHLEEADIHREIGKCRDTLEQLFSQRVTGMAYPFGTYDDRVIRIAKEEGVLYARTCVETETFELPTDLLLLPSTCRHGNPRLLELARQFVESETEEPQMLYIWGHSYEFDELDNWSMMEEVCRIISGKQDIFYGTNAETLLSGSEQQVLSTEQN